MQPAARRAQRCLTLQAPKSIPIRDPGIATSFRLFQFPNIPTSVNFSIPRSGKMILSLMDQSPQPGRPTHTRRYQRYELETELKAAVFGVEPREMRGRSLNINEGGIGGVFVAGWDVGTSVNLQFSVPVATTPIQVKGIVRNCTGYRYGFEFADLTPEERETITRTCRTLDLLQ
jgi:hypothetical protein